MYYVLHLNTSDSNKESSSENSEAKMQKCSKNSCKSACLETGNGTSKVRNSENIEGERNQVGNQAVLLQNRLRMLSICLNGTLMMQRFLYFWKDLILFQHTAI